MEDIQGEIVQVLVHTVKEKDVSANVLCHGMVTASFRTWESTAPKL